MQEEKSILDNIRIAAPCPVSWSGMTGDERKRFCNQCNKHVYNLSEKSRREAEALITESEGKICVRLYKRKDGTVITDNCPVGLRALRNAYRRTAVLIGTGLAALLSFLPPFAKANPEGKGFSAFASPEHMMGDIAPSFRTMGVPAFVVPPVDDPLTKYKKQVIDTFNSHYPVFLIPRNGQLQLLVHDDGELKSATMIKSTGVAVIDNAILLAVRNTRLPAPPDPKLLPPFYDMAPLQAEPNYRKIVIDLTKDLPSSFLFK